MRCPSVRLDWLTPSEVVVPIRTTFATGREIPVRFGNCTVSVKSPSLVGENEKVSKVHSPGAIVPVPPLRYANGADTTGTPGVHGQVPELQTFTANVSVIPTVVVGAVPPPAIIAEPPLAWRGIAIGFVPPEMINVAVSVKQARIPKGVSDVEALISVGLVSVVFNHAQIARIFV